MSYKAKTQHRKRFLALCDQSIELGLTPEVWRQAKAEMVELMQREEAKRALQQEKNAKLKELDCFLWQLVENGGN